MSALAKFMPEKECCLLLGLIKAESDRSLLMIIGCLSLLRSNVGLSLKRQLVLCICHKAQLYSLFWLTRTMSLVKVCYLTALFDICLETNIKISIDLGIILDLHWHDRVL